MELRGRDDGHPDYTCEKLIIATGQTSEENIPRSLAQDRRYMYAYPFRPAETHGGEKYDILSQATVFRVTVVYGCENPALDAVYLFAKLGKMVDWVSHSPRRSGFRSRIFWACCVLGGRTLAI